MEAILKKLNSIQQDKLAHALVGSIVFAISHLFFSAIYSIASVIFVAAMKEFYDSFHQDKHTVDKYDFIATVIGGLIGLVCTFKLL